MGGISIVHVGSNVRVDCGGPASKLWSSAHVTARAAKRPRAWNTCERTFNFEDDRPDGPNGSSSLLFLVLRRMVRSLDFPFLSIFFQREIDLSTLQVEVSFYVLIFRGI